MYLTSLNIFKSAKNHSKCLILTMINAYFEQFINSSETDILKWENMGDKL